MKTKDSPETRTQSEKVISDKAFAKLRNALKGAQAFERGKRGNHGDSGYGTAPTTN